MMPELPEVETVRQGLLGAMDGATITKAEVNRPDLRWPFPENMAQRITGQKVLGLSRRSKYILVSLASGETLIIHLGMSGRMTVSGDPLGQFHHEHPAPQKHDHVVFHMDNGAQVTFNDPRRFGAMDLATSDDIENHWLISKIGPEPLGNEFNAPYLVERLKTRAMPIKTALLDQQIVAGLGNIYVCEVLFRAGVSPQRKAKDISAKKIGALVPIIRDVLSEAIVSGGSSLKDYRQADGELGYFQHRFKVYDREGETCLNDGCGTEISRIVQSGRSSFFCKKCQR
ncbi:formamidopyrimidine-DNA glycosylase [Rhodobacteraceae bacterium HTCC2150]|nr:formamidopyrimidine-DNA glycosylase [Rhodobacteraceae bacterium HTCC2150]